MTVDATKRIVTFNLLAMDDLKTPPNAVTAQKQLNELREALQEVQHDSSETPPTAFKANTVRFEASQNVTNDSTNYFKALVLYENPALSFLLLLIGTFMLATVRYIMNGSHSMTLLSCKFMFVCEASCEYLLTNVSLVAAAISYLLLADLALNFVRSVFFPEIGTGTWHGSSFMNTVLQLASYGIEIISKLHDNFVASPDPHMMLRTGIVLLLIGHVGKYMGVWTLALMAFISIFTVPYLSQQYASSINATYSAMLSIVKSNIKAIGWTRKQRAAVFLLVMSLLWVWSTWFYRIIGVLIGAMAIRCNLKPAEIDAIRQHAAPLTTGVKKRAARLSIAASDFAQRTLGTKLHFK